MLAAAAAPPILIHRPRPCCPPCFDFQYAQELDGRVTVRANSPMGICIRWCLHAGCGSNYVAKANSSKAEMVRQFFEGQRRRELLSRRADASSIVSASSAIQSSDYLHLRARHHHESKGKQKAATQTTTASTSTSNDLHATDATASTAATTLPTTTALLPRKRNASEMAADTTTATSTTTTPTTTPTTLPIVNVPPDTQPLTASQRSDTTEANVILPPLPQTTPPPKRHKGQQHQAVRHYGISARTLLDSCTVLIN
jgi:hypothetical protein